MLHDFLVDTRTLHRRLTGGLRRVNKRVYTPTAVFTEPETTPAPATTTQPLGIPVLPKPSTAPTTTTQLPAAATPTTTTTPPPVVRPSVTTPTTTPVTTAITTGTTSAIITTTQTTPSPTTTPPPVTTPTTTQSVKPTQKDATTEVEVTVVHSQITTTLPPTGTALGASPTASSDASSSKVSTGAVVGGIIAAIIGAAGILFAVIYFVRRSRHSREDEADDFNADAFKHQSMVIPDDDNGSGMARTTSWNHGGARPPTMIEQKLANAPVSYNSPMPPQQYAYYNQPTFSPSEVYTPTTANSANPFFSAYDSRMGTPVSMAPYDAHYDMYGNLIPRPQSAGSSTIISRQMSTISKPLPEPIPEGDYVDMSRSSVTPYQAAQYADISRRLNATPPQGLPLTAVNEELEHVQEVPVALQKNVEPLELQPSIIFEAQQLSVQPTPRENSFPESPFADPSMAAEQQQHIPKHDSAGSILQPPEPAFSSEAAQKARIPSIPPMLPEISQRPFSSLEFSENRSSVRPAEGSPLATTVEVAVPSPPPNAHFPEASAPVVPARVPVPAPRTPAAKRPDTVYTLYDDEDAYGGI